jgi:hypothetical protein
MKTLMYVLRQPYCEVPSWLVKNFSWSVFNTIQLSISRCFTWKSLVHFSCRYMDSVSKGCHTQLTYTVTRCLHLHIASPLCTNPVNSMPDCTVLKSGKPQSEVSPPHYDKPNWKTQRSVTYRTQVSKFNYQQPCPNFGQRHHKMKIISKLNAAPLRFIVLRNRYDQ